MTIWVDARPCLIPHTMQVVIRGSDILLSPPESAPWFTITKTAAKTKTITAPQPTSYVTKVATVVTTLTITPFDASKTVTETISVRSTLLLHTGALMLQQKPAIIHKVISVSRASATVRMLYCPRLTTSCDIERSIIPSMTLSYTSTRSSKARS